MSQSKLTSLLKYRFVKNDRKQEGTDSASSSGSNTESQSQCSTQPPDSQLSLDLPDLNSGTPTNGSGATTVPETPSTDLPSPDSPVFGHKPKLINKNWGSGTDPSETDEDESAAASPWLSKANGPLTNGVSNNSRKKNGKRVASKLDEDSSDDEPTTDGFQKKLALLQQIFAVKSRAELREALHTARGDLEQATDFLSNPGRSNYRRIRTQMSRESTDSETAVQQPRKRIRQMLSSDSEEDETIVPGEDESQLTQAYSLESQRSDATEIYSLGSQRSEGHDLYNLGSPRKESLSGDQETKLDFLAGCFKDKSRKELIEVLKVNGWVVADATVSLSAGEAPRVVERGEDEKADTATGSVKHRRKQPKQPERIDIEVSDEDEMYESGHDSGDSDDSMEEEGEEAKTVKQVIVNFFDTATLEELIATPGCSKKKSELIISTRPYNSYETLVEKFTSTKSLSREIISGCRELIKMREVVIRLMQKCEKISLMMQQVVTNLLHSRFDVEDEDQIRKQPSNLNTSMQLKPFQMVGLNWLRIMHTQHLNGILADEMGLGKTIQTISFLAHLLEEGEKGPHVVIVPSSTVDNWMREMNTWCPALKVILYYGSQEDRRATRQYLLYNDADDFNVILTTYNMATGSVEDRALFKKYEFHYAIFDEGHLLKNMASLRYQNLMRISAERRLLLTGTPLQNNLLELMSLLCFVMPDIFIGKTEQLKRMFTVISRTGSDDTRSTYAQERITQAKQIMKPFVLRRLKSEVLRQLPSKLESTEYCSMLPDQQEVYDRLIQSYAKQISVAGDTNVAGGASMLMQLRKAANHPLLHRSHYTDAKLNKMSKVLAEEPSHSDRGALPALIEEDMGVMSDFELNNLCGIYKSHLKKFALDDNLIQESGKFRRLGELLDDFKSKGDRVLVFSQFTTVLDIMEVFMKQLKHRYIRLDGQTPVSERLKLIDQYNSDTDIYIFLLSTKAGGLGINLTSANVVILHDIDFNPYNDKQAEDRCHRVGQTKDVQVVRLITKDSVEEAMLKCAREKLKLEKDVTASDQDGNSDNPKDVVSVLKQALAATNAKTKS